jgi:hypothetical protein
MPQAMRCESVLDWQPAGERRVVGGLFAAASAVADVGLVGDCVAVEPEPDGASAARAASGAVGGGQPCCSSPGRWSERLAGDRWWPGGDWDSRPCRGVCDDEPAGLVVGGWVVAVAGGAEDPAGVVAVAVVSSVGAEEQVLAGPVMPGATCRRHMRSAAARTSGPGRSGGRTGTGGCRPAARVPRWCCGGSRLWAGAGGNGR